MAETSRRLSPARRARILAAARHLILLNGLRATTMEAIAREARVAKPTLYGYFPDKEAVFGAIIEDLAVTIGQVVATALSANGAAALAALRTGLANRIVEEHEDRIVFAFPPVAGDDAEQRLLAPTPLDALRQLLRLDNRSPEEPYALFAPFVLAFDYAANLEGLPVPDKDATGFPDYIAWLAESMIVFAPQARPRIVCAAWPRSSSSWRWRATASRTARTASRPGVAPPPSCSATRAPTSSTPISSACTRARTSRPWS